MPMLEQNSDPEIGSAPPHAVFEQQQRRRMPIALGVLLLTTIRPALVFLGAEAHWEKAIQGTIILLAVAADAIKLRRGTHVS